MTGFVLVQGSRSDPCSPGFFAFIGFARKSTVDFQHHALIEPGPMILSRKVIEHVVVEPFRPFYIKMASGQAFDIRHPEMILVGRTSVRVYTTIGADEDEKWHDVSLMLMKSIEPTDATDGTARI